MIRGIVSFAQECGPSLIQEDRYVYTPVHSNVSNIEGWLLAVMDGHAHTSSGNKVSELCRVYIPRLFSINYAEQAKQSLFELTQKLVRISTNIYQGSTLSLALVLESHHTVTVATMGDSPIIVIKNEAMYLAPSHNVRVNLEERTAAEERGGVYENNYLWVKQSNSDDRVPRGLQLSRSLGDQCMKKVLLRVPEIVTRQLTISSAVLLMTDGVCDISRSSFSGDIAKIASEVRRGADASLLMQNHIARNSLRDNATALLWSAF